MNTRKTKQKEIILDILDHNRTHPTIPMPHNPIR